MAIELQIIDPPPNPRGWDVEPGMMWREPNEDTEERECWVIVLPNSAGVWYTTQRAPNADNPKEPDMMWEVTGTPPKITVRPSINAEPQWHGSINNGVMS